MKKLATLIAIITAIPLAAQQAAPQEPTPEQLKALVNVLRQQRDNATQAAQDAQVQLQLVNAELEAAKKQLAEAKSKATAQSETKK